MDVQGNNHGSWIHSFMDDDNDDVVFVDSLETGTNGAKHFCSLCRAKITECRNIDP